MTRKAIGVIGLGQMGLPIAMNLLERGYEVWGYRRGNADDFMQAGGMLADSPRAVAGECDLILSCITDDAALHSVVSGPEGIASRDCTSKILVELSTLDLVTKASERDQLRAKGGDMIDGAISGIPPMVKERTAVFYVSGEKESLALAMPVLSELSNRVVNFGAFGNGTKAKLTTNLLLALNLAATAEALSFGLKAGLPAESLIDALKDGAAGSLQFRVRAPMMASHGWDNRLAPTTMILKDIALINQLSAEMACPTPLLSKATAFYTNAVDEGYGDADAAAIFAPVAKNAGVY